MQFIKQLQKLFNEPAEGGGPTLIECVTYRNYGHFEGDAQTYKSGNEKKEHLQEKDAIALFRKHLLSEQVLTEQELRDIEKEVEKAVQTPIEFSRNKSISR